MVHFNGPQTKFIVDSLQKHPVDGTATVCVKYTCMLMIVFRWNGTIYEYEYEQSIAFTNFTFLFYFCMYRVFV